MNFIPATFCFRFFMPKNALAAGASPRTPLGDLPALPPPKNLTPSLWAFGLNCRPFSSQSPLPTQISGYAYAHHTLNASLHYVFLTYGVGYYYEGFLSIQRAVDVHITQMLAGGNASARNVDVELKTFPYPPYTDDVFVVILQTQLPFIIMLSFIVTAPVICRDVVLEKEKKLKVSLVTNSSVVVRRSRGKFPTP